MTPKQPSASEVLTKRIRHWERFKVEHSQLIQPENTAAEIDTELRALKVLARVQEDRERLPAMIAVVPASGVETIPIARLLRDLARLAQGEPE